MRGGGRETEGVKVQGIGDNQRKWKEKEKGFYPQIIDMLRGDLSKPGDDATEYLRAKRKLKSPAHLEGLAGILVGGACYRPLQRREEAC